MNKTELKPGIFIEGFDTLSAMYDKIDELGGNENTFTFGVTDSISEQMAVDYVEYFIQRCKYKNYNPETFQPAGVRMNEFNYAVLSLKSACQSEYCVIWKK